jgi:hypothetical protein
MHYHRSFGSGQLYGFQWLDQHISNKMILFTQQVKAGVLIHKQYMIVKMTKCCNRLKNMISVTHNAHETDLFFILKHSNMSYFCMETTAMVLKVQNSVYCAPCTQAVLKLPPLVTGKYNYICCSLEEHTFLRNINDVFLTATCTSQL